MMNERSQAHYPNHNFSRTRVTFISFLLFVTLLKVYFRMSLAADHLMNGVVGIMLMNQNTQKMIGTER